MAQSGLQACQLTRARSGKRPCSAPKVAKISFQVRSTEGDGKNDRASSSSITRMYEHPLESLVTFRPSGIVTVDNSEGEPPDIDRSGFESIFVHRVEASITCR